MTMTIVPTYAGPTTAGIIRHYQQQQRGRGSGANFGQVYAGSRFQHGRGFGSFLSGIWRGISSLLSNPIVKSGAKVLGSAAVSGLRDYVGNVESGADKSAARKRALKVALADAAEGAAKKLRGQGYKRSRLAGLPTPRSASRGKRKKNKNKKSKMTRGGGGKKKKNPRCCKLKRLQSGGRGRKKKKTSTPGRKRRKAGGKRHGAAIKAGHSARSKFNLLNTL